MKKNIVVIGGGPAGMMAAIRASEACQDVVLIEKNHSLGKKLLLTGNGRCNITNMCSEEEFYSKFSRNGEFLRDAFKAFSNKALLAFFEEKGLKFKIEKNGQVFPSNGNADSVLQILLKELRMSNADIIYNKKILNIDLEDKGTFSIKLPGNEAIEASKVIITTGGVSYSSTGSSGDGLRITKGLGHTIVKPKPGLVALDIKENFIRSLEGISIKNASFRFTDGKRKLLKEGSLLFTKTGISGPAVLSSSGKIIDWLLENKRVYLEIDLIKGPSKTDLDKFILRQIKLSPKKSIKHILNQFPERLTEVLLDRAKILSFKNVSQVTQNERKTLLGLLKCFRLEVLSGRPIEEAMITRGGVSLKEVNPKTLESFLVKSLYFAGEILDLDGDTGGFNLQEAFSTGYLAGQAASRQDTISG